MPAPSPKPESSVKAANIFGRPLTIFGVPVDRDAIFATHRGNYNQKVEKRQRALIVKSTYIKFFLHPDERIRCLTTGYSPVSVMEQVATGPFFLLFKRAIFIFTDKRILHVPTRFNRQPRAAVSQILYEDCARLEVKGRALHIQYKNGKQEVFPYLGRKERKKICVLIDGLSISPKDAGQLKGRVHLCPSCTNILPDHATVCNTCKLPFKTPLKAKLRSFLTPGGGYFYAHYPRTGVVAALLDIILITAFIYKLMQWRNGFSVPIALLMALAFGFSLAKLVSAFHSSKLIEDLVPEQKDFAVRKR